MLKSCISDGFGDPEGFRKGRKAGRMNFLQI